MNDILIIDDDAFLVESVKKLLISSGFSPRSSLTAADGFAQIAERAPDLLVLDLGLPDDDGVNVCRRIRSKWKFPVIMLTSRSDLMDKVIGLEVGADDYLTKPFEGRELVARIRSNLRRQAEYAVQNAPSSEKRFGPLTIDSESMRVAIDRTPVSLTALEFRLLVYLAANAGRVLARESLFETVWGYEEEFNSNSLDVFVYRLRSKLEKPGLGKFLHTHRGSGYRFEFEP